MTSREREGVLLGAGAGLMLVVLLVLQSLIGSGLLSTRTVTSTNTITTILTPTDEYDQVVGDVANRFLLLGSRDVTALAAEYQANATVEWKGEAAGMQGTYTGSSAIKRLLGRFPGGMTNITLSNATISVVGFAAGLWVVNSTFSFKGYDIYDGLLTGAISAQDWYAAGQTWSIAEETWTWTSFDCQFPSCMGP